MKEKHGTCAGRSVGAGTGRQRGAGRGGHSIESVGTARLPVDPMRRRARPGGGRPAGKKAARRGFECSSMRSARAMCFKRLSSRPGQVFPW
ncbi:hypothetical protein Sfum_0153 [Syntrophobacter fumaroxidans MPOB]|uniref:Uncharacterized protein n=1 Tax=Syntrophobacter fumaroxidans (strain DSM 10017 / MPOB) TaxID=335543 RepID=A0LEK3_SYNFM|nr:hypothetical protein Sfum_0153 [Syntrophobacter fumaroxidans MPOB]